MKRNYSYTINLTEQESQILEALAKALDRKPRELLRLLATPQIIEAWQELQLNRPENKHAPTLAHFTPTPKY